MTEIIDGQEQIVMSLGGLKAASRGALLGLERAQVYELRTDARKSNDAVKKGIASPLSDKPAPAVTAGSSPESREMKSGAGMKIAGKELSVTPETKAVLARDIDVFDRRGGYSLADATTGKEIKEINLRREKEVQTYSTLRFKTTEQAQTYADKVNRAVDRAKKPTTTAKTPMVSKDGFVLDTKRYAKSQARKTLKQLDDSNGFVLGKGYRVQKKSSNQYSITNPDTRTPARIATKKETQSFLEQKNLAFMEEKALQRSNRPSSDPKQAEPKSRSTYRSGDRVLY